MGERTRQRLSFDYDLLVSASTRPAPIQSLRRSQTFYWPTVKPNDDRSASAPPTATNRHVTPSARQLHAPYGKCDGAYH